jgi:hypothetical protein
MGKRILLGDLVCAKEPGKDAVLLSSLYCKDEQTKKPVYDKLDMEINNHLKTWNQSTNQGRRYGLHI